MHKPVDNLCSVRITAGVLWISCGRGKTQNEFPQTLARRRGKAVEILSPLETGTVRGKPRDVGGPGNRHFTRVLRYRRAARNAGFAGLLAGRVWRCQARPPPSHTWRGPCPFCSGKDIIPGTSPAANIAALTKTAPSGPNRLRILVSHRRAGRAACGRPGRAARSGSRGSSRSRGSLASRVPTATCASSRARCAPRQKCGPCAKARWRPAFGPAHVERVRVGEDRRVPVRPGDGHGHLVAGPDRRAAEARAARSRSGRRPPRPARAAATPRPPRAPGWGRRAPGRAGRGRTAGAAGRWRSCPRWSRSRRTSAPPRSRWPPASASGPVTSASREAPPRDHLAEAGGQLTERRRPACRPCRGPGRRSRPGPRPRSRRTRSGSSRDRPARGREPRP